MHYMRIRVVIFLAAICIQVYCSDDMDIVRELYGPELCSDACRHTIGCSVYTIQPSSLSCYMKLKYNGSVSSAHGEVIFHLPQDNNDRLSIEKNCSTGSRIFKSRFNNLQCVARYGGYHTGRKAIYRRMLMAPQRHYDDVNFQQLNLHDNSVSAYSYLNMSYVNALAFVQASEQILVAHSRSKRTITSSPLNKYGVAVLRKKLECVGMAVDQERFIVFMIIIYPRKAVCNMRTGGTLLDTLYNQKHIFGAIALDPAYKLVYLRGTREIVHFGYRGENIRKIKLSNYGQGLTVDTHNHVIYYNLGGKINKLSVLGSESSELVDVSYVISEMLHFNGNLYLIPSHSPVFSIIKDMKAEEFIRYGFSRSVSHVTFCIIP